MARSTRTSLAGQVASVARKAVGRQTAAEDADGSAETTEKDPGPAAAAPANSDGTTPARKTAKKAVKAAAGTASAGAPVGKESEPTSPPAAAKKAAPRKTTPQTPAAKAAPAKATPVKTTAAKTTPETASATKAPARRTAAKRAANAGAAKKSANGAAGALAVKEGEEAWTKAELKEVLDELHEQRDHSAEILEHQESELTGLMRDSGDGAGHDQADMGATSFERDHELTVLNIEREKVAQIDRALARIEDGTYGVCESCGNPIGKMRVMAFPRATLCLTCKQREERR
jgi:RNA polymerase-binding protein DksA